MRANKNMVLPLLLGLIFLFRATPLWAVPVGFVYATTTGGVLAYSFDETMGSLTQIEGSPFSVGLDVAGPGTITVDPTRQFLYATVSNPDGIKMFTIDGATGALTLAPGPPVPTGDGRPHPISIAVDPSGQFLYVANRMDGAPAGSLAAFTIAADTGMLTPISQDPPPFPLGRDPWAAAVDPTGQYLYVVNATSNTITADSIDAVTGAVITIPGSPFPVPGDPPQYGGGTPRQLVVRPDGQFLYVVIDRSPGVIQQLGIDPGGELRRVINSPFLTAASPQFLTVDPTGQFLFADAPGGPPAGISAYTIDYLSGNLFPVSGSPFPTTTSWNLGIAVDPTARFVYVTVYSLSFGGPSAILGFKIEADGALTPVPGSPFVMPSTAGVITTAARRFFPQP